MSDFAASWSGHILSLLVVVLATAGVIIRPFGLPEYTWAVGGGAVLVLSGLLSPSQAWAGVAEGTDVYLFLAGMMLLAELARQEGVFDWLAAHAVRAARGSAQRLFGLLFSLATLVTVFLSNDATAVVLTPAVAAAVKIAAVGDPLPFLFICAFVANAASFVLPISNPANLVIYGVHMPPLLQWLPRFAIASLASVGATYAVLRWTQRKALRATLAADIAQPALALPGRLCAVGIVATAIVLLTASGCGLALGLPTAVAGGVTAILVRTRSGHSLAALAHHVPWGVLPLVAGLFVLTEALDAMGATTALGRLLQDGAAHAAAQTAWLSGLGVAFACNLVNNLPAGLVAGRVAAAAGLPDLVRSALLVGVDVGPNLSITGSLATILWLTALRRDGHRVGAWRFLKLGVLVMTPALILALAALTLGG